MTATTVGISVEIARLETVYSKEDNKEFYYMRCHDVNRYSLEGKYWSILVESLRRA